MCQFCILEAQCWFWVLVTVFLSTCKKIEQQQEISVCKFLFLQGEETYFSKLQFLVLIIKCVKALFLLVFKVVFFYLTLNNKFTSLVLSTVCSKGPFYAAKEKNMLTPNRISRKPHLSWGIEIFTVWKWPCHVSNRSLPHSHSWAIKARHTFFDVCGTLKTLLAPTTFCLSARKHLKMGAGSSCACEIQSV